MLNNESNHRREPVAEVNGYEHLNTSTIEETEANQLEEELAQRVDVTRALVATWLERIAKWRVRAGPEAELRREFYAYHPAFDDLSKMLSTLFPIAEEDEVKEWAIDTLAKVTRDSEGNILYAGKGERGIDGMIDVASRAANVAIQACDISAAGLASQQVELGHNLKAILWADDWPIELPIVVGIREAVQ